MHYLDCMHHIETWSEYVARCSHGALQKDIAERIGVNHSTVGRWREGVRPQVEHVVAFARAYERSPLEAFIAAGFLAPEDLGSAIEITTSMRDVSDTALLDELTSRLARYRSLLVRGNKSQNWPPAHWRRENPGMGPVEGGNSGG